MAFYWVNIHYGPLDNVILMKNTWNPNSAKHDRPTTQQAGDTDFVIAAAATFKIEESKLIPASAVKADFKGKTEIGHKCQVTGNNSFGKSSPAVVPAQISLKL